MKLKKESLNLTANGFETAREFFAVVAEMSKFGGETSHSYMAGFYEGFLKSLAHVPQVQKEMASQIREFQASKKSA
jgi:hypothetical protein